ncbi:palindromic element RPE4 domain-containing protein [Rickettsia endosymbiont of Ceutorhynchus obstrictus]
MILFLLELSYRGLTTVSGLFTKFFLDTVVKPRYDNLPY